MFELSRWDAQQLARGLGWFSLAVGLVEVIAPGRISAAIGFNKPEHQKLVRGYGAREVASGATLLIKPDNAGGAWGRVGGDVLDLATLAAARPIGRQRIGFAVAIAAVLGALVVDVICAKELTRQAA
jgi:hypothetical protein